VLDKLPKFRQETSTAEWAGNTFLKRQLGMKVDTKLGMIIELE
jgi:hypothetical protein